MKYYLFIDNFRGFKDTFVPITNVNFLVGENSTGKNLNTGPDKAFQWSSISDAPQGKQDLVTTMSSSAISRTWSADTRLIIPVSI
jgi:hypothetical protein